MVEFALTLPVLLLVVTGITTFGLALNNYIQLTDAVGVGARLLAVSRSQTSDPCNTLSTAVYNAAPFLKKTNLAFSTILNGNTYSGASCASGAVDMKAGVDAQVTVTYPCSLIVYGANYAPSCSLKAQTTERIQ